MPLVTQGPQAVTIERQIQSVTIVPVIQNAGTLTTVHAVGDHQHKGPEKQQLRLENQKLHGHLEQTRQYADIMFVQQKRQLVAEGREALAEQRARFEDVAALAETAAREVARHEVQAAMQHGETFWLDAMAIL